MANNKWIGKAQPRQHKIAMFPRNISPGSTWKLRVGAVDYAYQYPASVIENMVSSATAEREVVEGVVSQVSGQSFGGGTASVSVESAIVEGRWAILAKGSGDGAPIDVEFSVDEINAATVKVVELQSGSAAVSSIQLVKWPKTPTGGTLVIGYENQNVSVAYNANAATLQASLETIFGASQVIVTGSHTVGYTIEMKKYEPIPLLYAYSLNTPNIISPTYTVEKGGTTATVYSMPKLNGNSDRSYRLIYNDDESGHLFTGSSTVAQIKAAVESIDSVGAGNASVVSQVDGVIIITLAGSLRGTESQALVLRDISDEVDTGLTTVQGDTTADVTTVTITFKNKPAAFWGTGNTCTLTWGATTITVNFAASGTVGLKADIDAAIVAFTGSIYGSSAFPWRCVSVDGGPPSGDDIVVVFQSSLQITQGAVVSEGSRFDAGMVTMSLPSIGCYSIDVVEVQRGRKPRNAIQQIALHGDPDGGTFTLTHSGQTTSALSYNCTAAQVKTALEALSTINAGNVTVIGNDGGAWVVEFIGAMVATSQPLITGNGGSLTIANATAVVTTELSSPTGPNWWTNPKNWSLNAVPSGTDTVVFENGSIPCSYGISNVPAFTGLSIYRTYSGAIGLPDTRSDGQSQTLPLSLSLTNNASLMVIDINIGQSGDGPSLVRIDTQAQNAVINVPYSMQPANGQGSTIYLSGTIDSIIVGEASVGIATSASSSATVQVVKAALSTDNAQSQSLSWGRNATVISAILHRTSLNCESVPRSLEIVNGTAVVQGVGNLDKMDIRDSSVNWQASGNFGLSKAIEALVMSGSNVRVKSTAHGLSTGQIVYVSDLVGVESKYYTITYVDADNFVLIGSSINAGLFTAVYGGGSVIGSPRWGLANAIRIGGDSILEFASVGGQRTLVSPILLQSVESTIRDQSQSVVGLIWQCDPGFLTESFGRKCVFKRIDTLV